MSLAITRRVQIATMSWVDQQTSNGVRCQKFWVTALIGRNYENRENHILGKTLERWHFGRAGYYSGIFAQARGELVYEPEVSPQAPAQVRADDREQMRTVLSASEKAQATVQASQPVQQVAVQQVAPAPVYAAPTPAAQPVYQQPIYQQPVYQQQVAVAPVQQVAPAPVYAAPAPVAAAPAVQAQASAPQGVSADSAPATEVQSLSKTELMRRERTRTELKNEDLLQERLEELRLRDEKKRTDQLLGQDASLITATLRRFNRSLQFQVLPLRASSLL